MSATATNGSVVTGAATTTTTTAAAVTPASSSASSFFIRNLSSLGLGYAIAIALGFLVLLSTLLLASYVCCRASRRPRNPSPAASNGVVLPRIIFVAEDDDDTDANDEDEEGGPGRARRSSQGLDPAAISSYPRFQYSAAKSSGDNVCAICLGEYKDGETLRMMPDCRHGFHLPCIDAWLRLNASCPVCRTSPMPTPLSTPLSELVPLSHFPAGQRRR